MVISCLTTYITLPNQEIDIGKIYRPHSDFTSFYMILFVCILLCSFITGRCYSPPPPQRSYVTIPSPTGNSLLNIYTIPSPSTPTLWQPDAFEICCYIVFHCIDVPQFIYSPIIRYLGCFQFWKL